MNRTNDLQSALTRVLQGLSPNGRAAYEAAWLRWRALEQRLPREWTSKSVSALCDAMLKEAKPATVRLSFTVAKRVWQESQALGFIAEEAPYPFARLRIRGGGARGNVPEWNVMQPGELAKLDVAVTHLPREQAIIRALTMQGWRVSEMCNLKWEDLKQDPNGAVVAVFIGKGGKPARTQVTKKVLEAAERWAGKRRTGPFIARDKKGTPFTRQLVNTLVVRWTKRALGHKVTPHGLRATFVSAAIEQVGIEEARKLARHSDIATTQRYSRWASTKQGVELKF